MSNALNTAPVAAAYNPFLGTSLTWKTTMWASYSAALDAILHPALRAAGVGCTYFKVLDWARQLVVSGAMFLHTGDVEEGRIAMNRIDQLSSLPEIAQLCGKLATLIAAGMRRDVAQGSLVGRSILGHNVNRAELGTVWLIACPSRRRPAAAVVSFRKAA